MGPRQTIFIGFLKYMYKTAKGCGGAVAQSVERKTPGGEDRGSISAVAARTLLGLVGVSIMWPTETEVMISPLCLVCGSTYNCHTSVLGPVRDITLLLTRTVSNQRNKQSKSV